MFLAVIVRHDLLYFCVPEFNHTLALDLFCSVRNWLSGIGIKGRTLWIFLFSTISRPIQQVLLNVCSLLVKAAIIWNYAFTSLETIGCTELHFVALSFLSCAQTEENFLLLPSHRIYISQFCLSSWKNCTCALTVYNAVIIIYECVLSAFTLQFFHKGYGFRFFLRIKRDYLPEHY